MDICNTVTFAYNFILFLAQNYSYEVKRYVFQWGGIYI